MMDQNNLDFEQEHNSLKEVDEFQKNMYNPGYYVGTGKVPPIFSGDGNTLPVAVILLLFAVLFGALGFYLFFSKRIHIEGFVESDMVNRIITLVIMWGISAFLFRSGWIYWKKSKKYRQEKTALKNEPIDTAVEDKIWQRTCPKCGKTHDMDYPKCPNCKFDYLE